MVDDHDVIADELDLREEMRVQQHRGAARTQLLEQAAHDAAPGRVERARRLVEQQQRRRPDERLRDPEPLLHALRHRRDARPARLGEADELEERDALAVAGGRACKPLVQRQDLVRAHPGGKAEELRQVAERSPSLSRPRGRAGDLDRPGGRPNEAARDLHEGRLAGAVRAEEADELPGLDPKIDPRERLDPSEALLEAADREHGSHSNTLLSSVLI